MNNFQRKNPRIREKQVKLPYVFRSYTGFGPCRAWKNSDNKLYPYIVYKNSTVNLSLHILDGSIVSGSNNKKLRKQHIYKAAKIMNL